MMIEDLSLFLVFAAGLLSFLSPCVLPLIPSYLSILGGVGLAGSPASEVRHQDPESSRPRLVRAALAFILGFSVIFITLGIVVSSTFSLMGGMLTYLNRAAGIIVIVLGLNVIFDFLSFLNYEKRPFLRYIPRHITLPGWRKRQSEHDRPPEHKYPPDRERSSLKNTSAAFVAGAAFAAGWTPCIGPVLASILLMAGQSGKTGTAVWYLVVYSAGLGLPFLLAALFFNSFLKHAFRLRSHLPLIRRISGILLIIIGVMILLGQYSALNVVVQKLVFRYINWGETKTLPFRLLARALEWLQKF